MTCILVVFHGLSFLEIPSLLCIYMPTQMSTRNTLPRNPQFNFLLTLLKYYLCSLRLQMAAPPLNQNQNFHDFLPLMANKLGGDGLIGELCNGFNLLMDAEKGFITFESLKRNSALLGLQDLSDDDLRCMLQEGDFDGDGALSQMEFCVLMFRLSPELMDESQFLLEEALLEELNTYSF